MENCEGGATTASGNRWVILATNTCWKSSGVPTVHRARYGATDTVRIAYLLDVFPVLSETFIVREIYALRKLGQSVCVFAVVRRQSSVVHRESAALVEHVRFLAEARLSQRKISLIPLHLKYMVRRPLGYAKALIQTIGRSRKVLRCFAWAPSYAELLRAEGVEHIHAHFVLHGCLHAMFISLLTGIPYSVTVHAHDIFHPKYAELRAEKLKSERIHRCHLAIQQVVFEGALPRVARREDKDRALRNRRGGDRYTVHTSRRWTHEIPCGRKARRNEGICVSR